MLWLAWMPVTIMASTVLVKQHLLMDIAAGIAWGGLMGAGFYWARFKLKSSESIGKWLFRLCLVFIVIVLALNLKHMARAFELFSMFVAEGSGVILATVIITVLALLALRLINRNSSKPV